jgi:hypothetical protein
VKQTLDHTIILVIPDVLRVHRIQIALAKGQVMDRIQDIGLAHTIFANEAIYLLRKGYFNLFIILKIDQRKGF